VSICSFGKSEENLMAGFYKLFTDYLDEQNVKTSTATAFEASVLMRKVTFKSSVFFSLGSAKFMSVSWLG
jgi:hypothetical protein